MSVKALEKGIRWGDCGSREPLSATLAEETDHKTNPLCCVADLGWATLLSLALNALKSYIYGAFHQFCDVSKDCLGWQVSEVTGCNLMQLGTR